MLDAVLKSAWEKPSWLANSHKPTTPTTHTQAKCVLDFGHAIDICRDQWCLSGSKTIGITSVFVEMSFWIAVYKVSWLLTLFSSPAFCLRLGFHFSFHFLFPSITTHCILQYLTYPGYIVLNISTNIDKLFYRCWSFTYSFINLDLYYLLYIKSHAWCYRYKNT